MSGGEQVAAGTEVRSNDSMDLDKALRVPAGLKPSHAFLPALGSVDGSSLPGCSGIDAGDEQRSASPLVSLLRSCAACQ